MREIDIFQKEKETMFREGDWVTIENPFGIVPHCFIVKGKRYTDAGEEEVLIKKMSKDEILCGEIIEKLVVIQVNPEEKTWVEKTYHVHNIVDIVHEEEMNLDVEEMKQFYWGLIDAALAIKDKDLFMEATEQLKMLEQKARLSVEDYVELHYLMANLALDRGDKEAFMQETEQMNQLIDIFKLSSEIEEELDELEGDL